MTLEGHAIRVSRQQAKLELKRDGYFYLRNLGARPLVVNNTELKKVRDQCSLLCMLQPSRDPTATQRLGL